MDFLLNMDGLYIGDRFKKGPVWYPKQVRLRPRSQCAILAAVIDVLLSGVVVLGTGQTSPWHLRRTAPHQVHHKRLLAHSGVVPNRKIRRCEDTFGLGSSHDMQLLSCAVRRVIMPYGVT